MKPKPLTPEQLRYVDCLFGYNPATGYIWWLETMIVVNARKAVNITFRDGTKNHMPLKRLAYILAFKKAPLERVRIRKGPPILSLDSLVEEVYITNQPEATA